MKQVVINFSELTAEAKRKYLQFLADNNIKVNEENQTIQVRVPKASMPQQHRARQYSTLTDIRNCKAFTPASMDHFNPRGHQVSPQGRSQRRA